MIQLILSGVIMFVVFFCINFFLGLSKDKDGNKNLGLSLLGALIAAVAAVLASWIFFER